MTTFLQPPAARPGTRRMAALALSVLSIAVAARAQDVSPLPVGLREQEIFLETGRVSKVRGVKAGITGTRRATLVAGDVLHDVSVQTVDESLARFESARRVEFNFRDYWGYNVAAYRLGVLLGLDNIPPSVARRVDARPAGFTWGVDDVLMGE